MLSHNVPGSTTVVRGHASHAAPSMLQALGDMLNKQTGGRTMAAGMQRTQAGPITAQPGLTGPSQQPSVMPDVSRRPSVAPNLLVSTQAVFSPEVCASNPGTMSVLWTRWQTYH